MEVLCCHSFAILYLTALVGRAGCRHVSAMALARLRLCDGRQDNQFSTESMGGIDSERRSDEVSCLFCAVGGEEEKKTEHSGNSYITYLIHL